MNSLEKQFYPGCPLDEIAAYIDGELDAAREVELDDHFSGCEACRRELSQQKQFLCSLNSSLKNESELELPANFTKLIVANAESTVSGLRRPRERFNAIFICAGLFLFVLFAMGTGAGNLLDGIFNVVEKLFAIVGFFGQIVYSFCLGVAIILRSLAPQPLINTFTALALAALVAGLLMIFSRRIMRIRRA